jgi:predicted CoA-binding protein
VVAIGRKNTRVADIHVTKEPEQFENIDTVTLYLNPRNQQGYYDYILSLKPHRIIYNPGTENDELVEKAREKGIQTKEACTLVMLSTNQY